MSEEKTLESRVAHLEQAFQDLGVDLGERGPRTINVAEINIMNNRGKALIKIKLDRGMPLISMRDKNDKFSLILSNQGDEGQGMQTYNLKEKTTLIELMSTPSEKHFSLNSNDGAPRIVFCLDPDKDINTVSLLDQSIQKRIALGIAQGKAVIRMYDEDGEVQKETVI